MLSLLIANLQRLREDEQVCHCWFFFFYFIFLFLNNKIEKKKLVFDVEWRRGARCVWNVVYYREFERICGWRECFFIDLECFSWLFVIKLCDRVVATTPLLEWLLKRCAERVESTDITVKSKCCIGVNMMFHAKIVFVWRCVGEKSIICQWIVVNYYATSWKWTWFVVIF